MPSYICIHGHFYQPPRENPFTGKVPDQPTAAPYPNWNVRITEECYRANAHARILDKNGEPARELNNYEWISFDFGPTLLSWLEDNAPDTYQEILEADRRSVARFGGHGSAMAHSYNHTILPLSTSRDKRTQVRWGIADFEHRFGRRPEGMWLPETAVDFETLEILASEGIQFTVLSPYQAGAVKGADGDWMDVAGGGIDPRHPYRAELGGGRSIAVFFYNGPLSQEIAFNGVLEDGKLLAKRLGEALGEPESGALLSHVATDGETYGHHHRFGEMALATAIVEVDSDASVTLTNYGEFLSLHPAEAEVKILEDSSWSCAHGVERWRADCGCSTGANSEWGQAWRKPLREALDWLRDELAWRFEQAAGELLDDPWKARDDYIELLLGGGEDEFLERHGAGGLSSEQQQRALDLLEIQHRAMLMYTSCGWFFDDLGRIEAILVLRHAGRVISLSRKALRVDPEPGFLQMLDEARSNDGVRTGRDIYEAEVSPFMLG